ncbi:DUF6920 family protein [Acidobacteriota bacterium]
MTKMLSLDELWKSTPPAKQSLEPGHLADLPDAARRYLEHAIAPGTPLASAVRLQMHGEIKLKRWGNPEGKEYLYADFGGIVERECAFGGYTIPTQLNIGWYFGTERFESKGEFFRVQIDHAEFR